MKLAVLSCPRCGAPLPLTDAATARCARCGSELELPEDYVALHRYAASARETRRAAELAYRELMRTSVPANAPDLWMKLGIPGLVIGIPLVMYLTQDLCGWQVRSWVTFAVFFPLLFGCLMLAGIMAAADPASYLSAIGGRIRPGAPTPSGSPTCGACGAPLAPEPGALCATCDYCLADSWLADVPAAHVEGTSRERQNLTDLVRAASFRTFDMRLFVVVSLVIAGGFLLFVFFGL